MPQNMKKCASQIGKYVENIETVIASVAFILMCACVLITVVFRFILHQPISWAEEAARYSMITGIFIAMPLAVRGHVHLGVDIVVNLLPEKRRRFAHFFSDIITLIAYIAIDYACYLFVLKSLKAGQTSPAMHIPIVWMYFVIMLGFILATIAQITNIIEEHKIYHHIDETTEEVKI